VHSLKGEPNVIDLRNIGLVAGIELASIPGKPGACAFDAYVRCFERGLLVRQTGDILALSPPLIIEKQQIDDMFGILSEVLKTC
jgi:beta-alanine--pyruvate transaminase